MLNRYYISLFLFIQIILLHSGLKASEKPLDMFDRANQFYQEAVYDSALFTYQQLLQSGFESADLYYNIGNTYFKLRQTPRAILYYEKAKKIHPNDEDIQHNLDLANTMIVDKIEPLPLLFYKVWWNNFYGLFSANAWAWISILLVFMTLIFTFLFLTSNSVQIRKTGFFAGLLFLLAAIGALGLSSQKFYYTQKVNEAIIFAPTITVKSSPSFNSVDLFVIHEGTKVSLIDKTGEWTKIRIANGSVGWLPADAYEGI